MSFSNQELQQLKSLLSTGITALEKKSREQKRVIDELVQQKQPFKQAGTKSVVDKLNDLIRYHYKGRDKVTAKLAKVRDLQSAVKRELTAESDRQLFHTAFGGGNSNGGQWGCTYDDLSGNQIAGYARVIPETPVPAVAQVLTTTTDNPGPGFVPANGWSDFVMEPAFVGQPQIRTLELREEDVQGHRGYVRMVPKTPDPSYMQDHWVPNEDYWLRRNDEACKDGKQVDKIVKDYIDGDKSKESNPKDMIGSNKLPLHLWPNTATAMGCLGFLNGMLKYGRSNFRIHGIRASIYYDAAKRHLDAWFEGEECDPDDGVPHLAAALACIAIIVDAQAAGKLNDDRSVEGGYRALVDRLTPHVPRLKALHEDKDPYHFTIADSAQKV
jgi:hypothetical protein